MYTLPRLSPAMGAKPDETMGDDIDKDAPMKALDGAGPLAGRKEGRKRAPRAGAPLAIARPPVRRRRSPRFFRAPAPPAPPSPLAPSSPSPPPLCSRRHRPPEDVRPGPVRQLHQSRGEGASRSGPLRIVRYVGQRHKHVPLRGPFGAPPALPHKNTGTP